MPNYGEQKGERKAARALAAQQRRRAHALIASQLAQCPSSQNETAARWDAFYQTKPRLFKDRNILRQTCPELVGTEAATNPKRHVPLLEPTPEDLIVDPNSVTGPRNELTAKVQAARERGCDMILLETGCGGGNTVFPVLRANPRLFAFAFDFSKEAISVTRSSPEYRCGRIHAFQADLTKPDTFLDILKVGTAKGADFISAFWTLSALPSSAHQGVVSSLASALADGGTLFFRDYAVGDMREEKFLTSGRLVTKDASGRLFLRGDGTYAYFFEKEELHALFERAGLLCDSCEYEERIVENRKEGLVMSRRWLKATFKKIAPIALQCDSSRPT